MRVHHLAVVVKDLKRSSAFYGEALGLRELRRWQNDQGADRSIWYALEEEGGCFLAVELAAANSTENWAKSDGDPGWHCIALAIQPSEREYIRNRLAHAGIAIERESPYTLYIRDPDGALIGLSHYPDAANSHTSA